MYHTDPCLVVMQQHIDTRTTAAQAVPLWTRATSVRKRTRGHARPDKVPWRWRTKVFPRYMCFDTITDPVWLTARGEQSKLARFCFLKELQIQPPMTKLPLLQLL